MITLCDSRTIQALISSSPFPHRDFAHRGTACLSQSLQSVFFIVEMLHSPCFDWTVAISGRSSNLEMYVGTRGQEIKHKGNEKDLL